MKRLGAAIVFFSLAWAAIAQTNPTLEATNLLAGARRMSLQDCIQQALTHNFDVQIQRYNPEISLYNLRGVYSGWDPTFSFSGQHEYSVQPPTLNSQNLLIPSATSTGNSFDGSLSGLLPWGFQYSLQTVSPIEQRHGVNFGGTTNVVAEPFQSSSGSVELQMTQPILKNFWIDSTRLKIKQGKNTLQYSEEGFRQQLITSVTAVANAYYELIFALENLKVQEEALELSQTQLDQDKQRLAIGTLAQLSVSQDQSQVAQNRANVIAAQSTLETDQNTLKNLITDNYSQWHAVDIQPSETLNAPLVLFNLEDSWSRGMTQRPDLLQARLNVEKQGIQLKFDVNQLFPELDLIGTYGYNGAGAYYDNTFTELRQGNSPFYTAGAQISLPLGNVGPRNTYKSDKVTKKQLLVTLKQLEQTILVDIDNAVKTAQSDYESVDATRQARIYAEQALDAEQKTYSVGKATTFEVLTYQNNLTAARGQEIRALANYEESLANLAAAEGSTLDKLNITVQAD